MIPFKRNFEGEKRIIKMFEKDNMKVLIDLVNENPISSEFESKCLNNISPDKEWLYRYPEKAFFEVIEKLIGPHNDNTKFAIIINRDECLNRRVKTEPEMREYLRNNVDVKRNIVRNSYREGKISEMFKKEQLRQKLDALSDTDPIRHFAERIFG